jgi:hypothetical protein
MNLSLESLKAFGLSAQSSDLAVSLVGSPSDCFASLGASVCQNTVFGKLNDILYNKLGAQTNIAGKKTLFQLLNLMKENVSGNQNSFGEETIYGILKNLVDLVFRNFEKTVEENESSLASKTISSMKTPSNNVSLEIFRDSGASSGSSLDDSVSCDLLSSLIGSPSDCFSSGASCNSTLFGKLNDIFYDKLGFDEETAGENTLFQIVNLILQDLTKNPNDLNQNPTLYGLAQELVTGVFGLSNQLATSQANLSSCGTSLSSCNTQVSGLSSQLSACGTSLSTSQANLATCGTNLSSCSSQLSACNANLSSCTTEVLNLQNIIENNLNCPPCPICPDPTCTEDSFSASLFQGFFQQPSDFQNNPINDFHLFGFAIQNSSNQIYYQVNPNQLFPADLDGNSTLYFYWA